MRGVEIVGKDGEMRTITIAFRPRDGRFEVADAAIRNDPEFLPNVTELWDGRRLMSQIRRDLIDALRDKGRAVDNTYHDAVEWNLGRAHAITDYRFPTVDIPRPRQGRMRRSQTRTSPRSSSASTTRERDSGKRTLC
jgi:hypothetical protein